MNAKKTGENLPTRAQQFYDELIDATESFNDLDHDVLALLLYLQGAILKSTYIEIESPDNDPFHVSVRLFALLETMPGFEIWKTYIQIVSAD